MIKWEYFIFPLFIKNVSSFTSNKKLRLYVFTKLREFKKILLSTFIYEAILIKILLNANIMNMQIFYSIVYDLKVHWSSNKVTFIFENPFIAIQVRIRSFWYLKLKFPWYIFPQIFYLFKTFSILKFKILTIYPCYMYIEIK